MSRIDYPGMTAEGARSFAVAAEVYDRFVGRYAPPLARAHVERLDLGPGDGALDVGCGPGAQTAAMAAVVGGENVVAVDPSEPFAAACRERVPAADVRVAPAEALPVFGRELAVASSQLVVNFMTDAPAGVRAMRDAVRAGGTVASVVWDYAGEMTMLRAFWDAALELDPDAPDEGRTMRYCTTGELEALWRDSGLEQIESDAIVVEASYSGFDDLWAPFPIGVGPAGTYCASLDAAGQAALREGCFRRLGSPAGSFTLSARAWFVRGRVPA